MTDERDNEKLEEVKEKILKLLEAGEISEGQLLIMLKKTYEKYNVYTALMELEEECKVEVVVRKIMR